MRKGSKIIADKSGKHLPVLRARTKQINKIIKELDLDAQNVHEKYLAKKIAIQYFGFPYIVYPEGWENT
jgi:gas vesicle protein